MGDAVKIGPDFEISTDPHNWIVTRWVAGQDKDGNPKRHPKQTYHASLKQACLSVLDDLAADAAAGTAQEVIAAIARAETAICDATKGAKK